VRHVLLVDDDRPTLKALRLGLRAYDFEVVTASDAGSALDRAAHRPPEAVLLDLGLPDLDGVDVLRTLRSWSSVPVVVISARPGVAARVEALDAGADDYLSKPFAIDELAARLRAVLRRPAALRPPEPVAIGAYLVDLGQCTLTRADGTDTEAVHLTPTEWRLLSPLLSNPARLVTSRELLTGIWGSAHVRHTNYLRVYMAGLRRKLEPDPSSPRHLITEPGLGYRFVP
jgi:two-component system KDP operon response regulator KdpE